jgi:hypothetical protein
MKIDLKIEGDEDEGVITLSNEDYNTVGYLDIEYWDKDKNELFTSASTHITDLYPAVVAFNEWYKINKEL